MKNFEIKWEDPNTLKPHPKNDQLHPHQPDQIKRLAKLIKAYGWRHPIIVSKRSGFIIVGHGRWMAALEMKAKEVPVHYQDFVSDDEELGFLIADNGIAEWTKLDLSAVNSAIPEFDGGFDIDWLGIDHFAVDFSEKLGSVDNNFFKSDESQKPSFDGQELTPEEVTLNTTLASKFLVPPFSVLDARQGYWIERKRYWLDKGIQSEVGRGANLLNFSETVQMQKADQNNSASYKCQIRLDALRLVPELAKKLGQDEAHRMAKEQPFETVFTLQAAKLEETPSNVEMIPNYYADIKKGLSREQIIEEYLRSNSTMTTGTSIFDPVLCELLYRWYSAPDAKVLDPFAGGSVRGVVASHCGRSYQGIDLRAEQIEANKAQLDICADPKPDWQQGDSLKKLDDLPAQSFDFILSCPPYGDLEVYSDQQEDLSNMDWEQFLDAHAKIIKKACRALKENRFAAWVVGEIRFKNKDGFCRNFVQETIKAFEAGGAHLYNDAILVTSIGTLPMRAGRIFSASRKLGRTHQYVLIFCKGSPTKAVEACGDVQLDSIEDPQENASETTEFGERVTSIGGEL